MRWFLTTLLLISDFVALRLENAVWILFPRNLLGLPSLFSLSLSFYFKSVSCKHTGALFFYPGLVTHYLAWLKTWTQNVAQSWVWTQLHSRLHTNLHLDAFSFWASLLLREVGPTTPTMRTLQGHMSLWVCLAGANSSICWVSSNSVGPFQKVAWTINRGNKSLHFSLFAFSFCW